MAQMASTLLRHRKRLNEIVGVLVRHGFDADDPIDYFPAWHVGVRRAGSTAEWLA